MKETNARRITIIHRCGTICGRTGSVVGWNCVALLLTVTGIASRAYAYFHATIPFEGAGPIASAPERLIKFASKRRSSPRNLLEGLFFRTPIRRFRPIVVV